MASPRTTSGYNNPAYSNQYDYDQLARFPSPGAMNHRNQTYISTKAIDNYCYEDDEEIQMTSLSSRQQVRHLVREPPIGASTTLRIVETRAENRPAVVPTSPKRHQQPVERNERIPTTITSPRTPKKNVPVIVTSTPRKSNSGLPHTPRGGHASSPRRHHAQCTTPSSTPRKVILTTSPSKAAVRSVKYVPPQTSVLPQRSTAVISPLYSCANTSVVSTISTPRKEPFLATGVVCRRSPTKLDTSPGLKASWIHIPAPYQSPPTGTIVTAATLLLLCGAITAILCLYMMSKDGRRYYLDFGVFSGFGSALLGCLGFRSRRWQWLPNRNYVSGYIVLSMFSVLTCAGLIVILTMQPRPGEPLVDVAGGAVSGIAVLSLTLAALGVCSSRCCKYPPPDNRVEHCAEGFTL